MFSNGIQLTTKAAQLGVINAVFVQGSFLSNIRSELAHFPHFTYTNFRHREQVLIAVKLILLTFPNSLRIAENSSEGNTRLTKEVGHKLHCTSSTSTILHKITKELHLPMRLMEQQPTQQYSRNSYVVWNIQ